MIMAATLGGALSELLAVLFPHLAGLWIEQVRKVGTSIRLHARLRAPAADCPNCQQPSRSVHSRYRRWLADHSVGGQAVMICLQVRRFACTNPHCARRTFAEQPTGLAGRYQRRSTLLAATLTAVGLALGGRAGARLSHQLAVQVSRMTLLRLVTALPDPPPRIPQVLGVDDFALRRGHVYGTVLVDLDTGRPIELLPDRQAQTLAAGLTTHPGVRVVCRDRAGAYADAVRTAAPQAIQVADRWHLWHNLAEAVERMVMRHHRCLPEPANTDAGHLVTAPISPAWTDAPKPPRPMSARSRHGRLATRTRQRHAAIHRLLAQGYGIKTIATKLGLARGTVHRFARASSPEQLLGKARDGKPSILDHNKDHLHQRWRDGCTNAAGLFQEIRTQGYAGSYQTVRDYLHPLRALAPTIKVPPPAPKVRQVVGWITRHPDGLDAEDQQRLKAILARCPELDATVAHVRAFADLLCHRRGDHQRLTQWIAHVHGDELPALQSFAAGMQRDQDAVMAGLTLQWSSGAVEGHINKIKMLKRQMYGRASFALLRKRVLLT